MGTVGLNFGSPTSGAGFDVTTTVASIVSNLQNVETPWKNQLTTLQSQDTVISNLGTLFSTVSTDIGQLTDFEGVLAQKTGSSSDTNVLELTSASTTAVAGTHAVIVNSLAQTSSGYLAPITNASDTLSGSITLKVGTGTAQTINLANLSESDQNLAGLASAINSSGVGIDASVLTDSSGSRLSLVSSISGADGDITVTNNTIADATTSSGTLAYTSAVSGGDASITVDGVKLTSASNTVTNLIPGLTFQLLSASPQQSDGSAEPVQVVIANDNSGVETAVNQLVTDYNSLMTALTAQEGNTSTGTPEPLFGSPTLSLLQQQLLNSLNAQNPTGYLDSITDNAGVTLADSSSITISLGNGSKETIAVGSGTSSNGTFYTGSGSGYNTLDGLAATINAAAADTPIAYSGSSDGDTGTMTVSNISPLTGVAPELAGNLTIQVGSGTPQTVTMDEVNSAEGGTTLADVADYIHSNASTLGVDATTTDNGDGTSTLSLSSSALSAGSLTVSSDIVIPGSGVTAAIITQNGDSSLTLTNLASGTNGAMSVTSNLTANTPTALTYFDLQGYSSTTADSGTLGEAGTTDALTGSVTFQVGGGTGQTVTMNEVETAEGGTTLADLANYIQANYSSAVTAETVNNSDGTQSLTLTSNTDGSDGALTVTSNLYDSSNITPSTLNYTTSSDVNSLTSLGISLNNDGTMTFDASALDTLLNSDFSGVLGFFQNSNSWGQSFASMLNNAGSSSSTGILALAAQSNSNIETSLNTKITSENTQISTEQTQLTAELNQANEVLQELPSQLDGINELYSAITGYNQSTNG